MALNLDNLSTHGSGPPTGMHTYLTADAIGTVVGANYFDAATTRLRQGDMIFVASSLGGTMAGDVLVVTSATGAATVTVTNGT